MAKNRFINTKFWSDGWVVELDPLERYLYLYLLTDEHTNIAGIYELPIRVMAFETGIDKEMIPKMLDRFKGKVFYFDNKWVYLVNFIKHQNARGKSNVKIGIEKLLKELPDNIRLQIAKVSKENKPLQDPSSISNYLDLDLDLDYIETKKKKETLEEQIKPYKSQYSPSMIEDFINYWAEEDNNGVQAWEKAKKKKGTWDIKRRLATWKKQGEKFERKNTNLEKPDPEPKRRTDSGGFEPISKLLNK